jgi:SAM-dependent methyltransferase
MIDRSPLIPDPKELEHAWREMVEAEYEQVERLREWQEPDHYAPIAQHFADDPHRTDDLLLERLKQLSRPDATWLDIGAGGGRYALPLALNSQRVIAVEPSEGMRQVLRGSMVEHGITNIDLLDGRWPEGSDTVKADFSLAAHVGYDIREIGPFIDGMERATRERCCVMLMDRAPSSGFVRLWEAVHGERRHQLPSMREFLYVLLARGATPEVQLTHRPPHAMLADDVRANARRRLWLREGSEKDQKLQQILDHSLAEHSDDFQFPRVIALITWEPGVSSE